MPPVREGKGAPSRYTATAWARSARRWRNANASATCARDTPPLPARSATVRATRSVRTKPRADRRRRSAACSAKARAAAAVREGLREIGRGAGPVDVLGVRERRPRLPPDGSAGT